MLFIDKTLGLSILVIGVIIYSNILPIPTKPLQLISFNQISMARSGIIKINAQLVSIDSDLNFTISDGNNVLNITGNIQDKDILNFVTDNQKIYAKFSLMKQGDSLSLLSIKQIEHETYLRQIPLSDITTKSGLVGSRTVQFLK